MKLPCFFRSFLFACVAATPAVAGLPGDLDSTFGEAGTGISRAPASAMASWVYDLAVQPDGKILASAFKEVAEYRTDFAVMRYLPDGTPDPGFGSGGAISADFGWDEFATCLTIQNDGRIVAAGYRMPFEDVVVMRYLPDGARDLAFGVNGAAFPGAPNVRYNPYAVRVLSDGKILLGGGTYTQNPGSVDGAFLIRLNPNGSLDTEFSNGGRAVISGSRGQGAAIQPDGSAIVIGFQGIGGVERLWLARFDAAGQPDPVFGAGGKLTEVPLLGHSVAVQSDGRIVVAGETRSASGNEIVFGVVRLLTDGTPDPSFNSGTLKLISPASDGGRAAEVRIQSDGKLLVAGHASRDFAVARCHADGRLDHSFKGGIVKTETGSESQILAMTLQPDGRILTGGYSSNPSPRIVTLARYVADDESQPMQTEWPAGTVLKNEGPVDMGSVLAFSAETPEEVITIRNTGATELTGITAAIGGEPPHAARFTIVSPPAGTLAGGAATTLTVRFTPLTTISRVEAYVVIRGNNPGMHETTVALLGATRPAEAVLTVHENGSLVPPEGTVDFGVVATAEAGSRVFTIRNSGNIDLLVQGISLMAESVPGGFTAEMPAETLVAARGFTTFPVTFSAGQTGLRTARLRIVSTDTYSPSYEINLQGRLASPLEKWRQAHFGSPRDEGTGADLGDADGDGVSNVLEYATLTNPRAAGALAVQAGRSGNSLEYLLKRPSAAAVDLLYALEWSESLNPASWIESGAVVSVLSDDGGQQEVKFSLPAGNSRRFVRLKVTRR